MARIEPDILTVALTLVAERGWRGFGLVEVARRTGLTLAQVHAELPGRAAVIPALGRRLDASMLAIRPDELDAMSPRERLFELLMRRFDAMVPYRPALRRLARDAAGDPQAMLASLCNLHRLAGWLVDAAGRPAGGLRGAVARKAVIAAYARAFRVWLDDDTADQARTLAELDKSLQHLESLARWGGRFCRRREGGEAAAAPAAA